MWWKLECASWVCSRHSGFIFQNSWKFGSELCSCWLTSRSSLMHQCFAPSVPKHTWLGSQATGIPSPPLPRHPAFCWESWCMQGQGQCTTEALGWMKGRGVSLVAQPPSFTHLLTDHSWDTAFQRKVVKTKHWISFLFLLMWPCRTLITVQLNRVILNFWIHFFISRNLLIYFIQICRPAVIFKNKKLQQVGQLKRYWWDYSKQLCWLD